ncbi:hypothetical protein V1264_006908 [Littorina saxatilis]|uniref:PiggyBac transposable element-derived protein domain-containing protein n=1 Tax=Littorina saxatilis TaxID=31220 RepID=A0AAN9AYI0_9CAEN
MDKRRRFTAQQVLDEIIGDDDSDFDPDIEDSRSESSESTETSSNNAPAFNIASIEPQASTSTGISCDNSTTRPVRLARGRGRAFDAELFDFETENDTSSESESENAPTRPVVTARRRGRGRGRGGVNRNTQPAVDNVNEAPPPAETDENGWSLLDFQPELLQFAKHSGLLIDMDDNASCLDFFSLFIGEEQIALFVNQTNLYAQHCCESRPDASPHSMFAKWKPVTVQEMKVFLALTINMGLLWKPEIKQYWSTDPLCTTPFWGDYMARDRYLAILGFFHLVDNQGMRNREDKIHKVRPLFDHLATRFKDVYYPQQELSVDESMIPWRGRLSFRMFIPSKPTRYGIKMYCCCEADTGFVCRMQVYTGAGPNGPEKNHGENVVKRLTQDFLGKGHTIYMDSFFSSVALYEYLRQNNTMAVGTVISGRVGMPRSLHPKELKLKKGEFRFRRKGNLLCLRINDRKNVSFLSTRHTAATGEAPPSAHRNQDAPPVTKPVVILDYNANMDGVDNFDQNLGYYSFYRKTVKWWKRMAFHLIHLAKVQAYILYKQQVRRPKTQYEFTKDLIRQLLSDVPLKVKINGPKRDAPVAERLTARHFSCHIPATESKAYPQRLCHVCSFRDPQKEARYLRKKETRYMCEQCNISMCYEPCFKIYHTKEDYKEAAKLALNLEF